MLRPDQECIGRDAEARRLAAALDEPQSHAIALLGEMGSGKSALARTLIRHAQDSATRVLTVRPGEALEVDAEVGDRARFPVLRELLSPLSAFAERLPKPQLRALEDALSAPRGQAAEDPMPLGLAVTGLIAAASADAKILIVVDDAHLLDAATLDVLAFVCRRLSAVRADIVLVSRGLEPVAELGADTIEIVLGPLPDEDAHILLDHRTDLPRGPGRRAVLAQAQGNPRALLEFARAATADHAAGRRRPEHDPLPCAPETASAYRATLDELPAPSRRALRTAATITAAELADAIAELPELHRDVWLPAEKAGLITLATNGITFTHPLIRSAVQQNATFEERADINRRLARALRDQPDRRAWHLAQAVPGGRRYRALADLLENTAAEAASRSGPAAAACALERAAELTPDHAHAARLLADAAQFAAASGDVRWGLRMSRRAARIAEAVGDSKTRTRALSQVGWALTWTGRAEEAVRLQLSVARGESGATPQTVVSCFASAAVAAYNSGLLELRDAVRAALEQTLVLPSRENTEAARPLAEPLASLASNDARALGAVASWVLDEPEAAITVLRRQLADPGARTGQGLGGHLTGVLAWAYVDCGRWGRAMELAQEILGLGTADPQDISTAVAHTVAATVAAHRGDCAAARSHARAAEDQTSDGFDPGLAVAARASHALALADLAEREYDAAFVKLLRLLGNGGPPLHYHASGYGLADFALAAVRTGRAAQAREVVDHVARSLDTAPSARLEYVICHARALVAEQDDEAAELYLSALVPDSGHWPFEQATTRLHFAQWLRRHHRAAEAPALLIAARRAFDLLDAEPWVTRTDEELRAARVATPGADPGSQGSRQSAAAAWASLSADQRRILILAAQGRSNREIAEQLGLSHRTVGSQLYRAFPRLGISARHQIREVIAQLGPFRPTR
jgi:DNA-binding CsgD family transcriptional regulator